MKEKKEKEKKEKQKKEKEKKEQEKEEKMEEEKELKEIGVLSTHYNRILSALYVAWVPTLITAHLYRLLFPSISSFIHRKWSTSKARRMILRSWGRRSTF